MDVKRINSQIERMKSDLLRQQSPDGAWRLCFDSGTMSDSYFIIILRMLERSDESLIHSIADRIASKQYVDGAWRVYPDETEGNLDATAEACFALLYSGYYVMNDPRIIRAKHFIQSKGGLSEVRSLLTQVILSVTGQAEWPRSLRIPLEAFFSGHSFGIDLFSLSGHARVHLVPILIMAGDQFVRRTARMPDLSDLFLGRPKRFVNDATWVAALTSLLHSFPLSEWLSTQTPSAKKKAEQFMFERIEPNSTLLTFSTATMLMILSLLSLGYNPYSPVIDRMIVGIRSLMCRDRPHVQVASAEVWDTAMLTHALRQAGTPVSSFEHTANYLRERQQNRIGDWALRNPDTPPGGWGFSDVNTLYPDVDDSVAALRAIRPYLSDSSSRQADWQRGLNWVLTMRNDNGGWPAFEREGTSLPISFFTFEGAADIALDPSTPDLTGRTLQFLGNEMNESISDNRIEDTVRWLLSQQEKDGSWYGRWGITYTHGTGAVVQGLTAVGVADDHPAIRKAVKWLLQIQNDDGGWGESCLSDKVRRYMPLHRSTPSQTAWALDALIAANSNVTPAIERGVEALLQSLEQPDWTYTYPTGAALPGSIYVHYPSNNYIWPLLTLSSFLKKYAGP